jgi:hypothetical protein
MKTIKILINVITLIMITAIYARQSQQKIEMKIDAVGNTLITLSMSMNAMEWQNWSNTLGNNPAALKREIQRAMPAYILDDFKLEKDDMNRSFKLSLNAYGTCKVDKRGNWILETDQKNAQLTKLTDYKYMLVSSPPELGGTVQQTYIIEFPEQAKDIKTDTDAYGKSIFKFKMDSSSTPSKTLRWAGFFSLFFGAAWLSKLFASQKK